MKATPLRKISKADRPYSQWIGNGRPVNRENVHIIDALYECIGKKKKDLLTPPTKKNRFIKYEKQIQDKKICK